MNVYVKGRLRLEGAMGVGMVVGRVVKRSTVCRTAVVGGGLASAPTDV